MSEPIVSEKFAVGQSVRRLEDPRLIQGLGRYSDDVDVARQAHAVMVRSPHAHARLRGIDTAAARALPAARDGRTDPTLWAAFILIGDGR